MNESNWAPAVIGREVKALMQLIAEIDTYAPDEDMVEVLIGAVSAWGTVEAQILFPAIEATLEGAEEATQIARERLNTLYSLSDTIHLGEGADGPFNELAIKYIDGVKYHLLVDIQEIVPLASQLPEQMQYEVGLSMSTQRGDIE